MLTQFKTAALAVALAAGSAFATVTFTPLGIPAPGDPQTPPFSDAYGVSNTGVVVGYMFVPGQGFLTFRWTSETGLVQINGLTPESGIFALAITPDGTTMVGENTNPNVGFRKRGDGPIEDLGIPNPDLYDATSLRDVSDDGRVSSGLLSRIEDGTFRATRWTEDAGWEDLGVIGSDIESAANAISADGSIVAGYSVGNSFKAFSWTASGGMVELPHPIAPGLPSAAIAMSADGQTIVGQASNAVNDSQPAVWTGGVPSLLPIIPVYNGGAAFGVSGDGQTVGGVIFDSGSGVEVAAFWVNGVPFELEPYLESQGIDLTGWFLSAITEVSQNGRYLVGRGINPTGNLEAFIVQLTDSGANCNYDFNQDENIDLTDPQQMAQVFVGLISPEANWLDGDLNGDENADLTDAQILAAYVVTGNCAI